MVYLEPITEETPSELLSTISGGTRASASQAGASRASSSDHTIPRNNLTSSLRSSSRRSPEEQRESDVPAGIRNNGLKRWWHVMGMSSASNRPERHDRSHRPVGEDCAHSDSGSRSGSESGHSSTFAVDMGDDGIVSHAHGSSLNLLPPLDLDADNDDIGGCGGLYPISSMDNEVGEAGESDGVISLGSLSASTSSPAQSPRRTKSPGRIGTGNNIGGGVNLGEMNASGGADDRKVSFSQNVHVAKIPFGHGGNSPRRSPGRRRKPRNGHLNGGAGDGDENATRRCSRSQLLIGFTLLSAFLGVVIGVSIHLISSSGKSGGSSNINAMDGDVALGPTMGKEDDDEFVTDAPTLEPEQSEIDGDGSLPPVRPTLAPTVDPYRDEILAAADALIRSISPSTATAIDDESETPQNLAYQWITTWDEANLELDVGQPRQGNHRKVVSDRRYIQRFVLGVLYFAMGGKGSENHNARRLRDVAQQSKAMKATSLSLYRAKRNRMLQEERLPDAELPKDEETYSEPNSSPITVSDPFHNFLLTLSASVSTDDKPFISAHHECQWLGITCESRSSEEVVVAIDLSNLGLVGTIPEEIGIGLEAIEDLTLYNNDIFGTIPPSLMTLPNLFYVDLGSNYLVGSIPPISTTLQYLYLNTNRLTGRLPRGKNGLDYKLKHLWAQQCQLTGRLSDRIDNFDNLEQLVLYENRISGTIPTTLSSLSVLSYLDLSSNRLTGALPDTLLNMTSLSSLYLSRNQLSGSIAGQASSLSKLAYLWLDDNEFSGEILPIFGDNNLNLKSLLLSGNNLFGTMPIQVCDLFGTRGELERLETDCAGEFPKMNCTCCTLCL